MMNKGVIIFHLKEALEELESTIGKIENDEDYSGTDLQIGMGHLYHHLNTAWNGRDQTDDDFTKCSEEDFQRFRRFPKEEEFTFLGDT